MDAKTFADQVLAEIQALGREIQSQITITEFVVQGRIRFSDTLFLAVYFNEQSEKIGFALIHQDQRIWGIDHDKMIHWHLHPLHETETHRSVPSQTISEIISQVNAVLEQLNKGTSLRS